jgi:cobalamin biosynthesis Co2+ chelatase CbiK
MGASLKTTGKPGRESGVDLSQENCPGVEFRSAVYMSYLLIAKHVPSKVIPIQVPDLITGAESSRNRSCKNALCQVSVCLWDKHRLQKCSRFFYTSSEKVRQTFSSGIVSIIYNNATPENSNVCFPYAYIRPEIPKSKEEETMRRKTVLALLLAVSMTVGMTASSASVMAEETTAEEVTTDEAEDVSEEDQAAADNVAALIDKIYVQERNETTDEDCAAAKEAWDNLTDAQKELVEGEEASPEYFGRDTGDASLDDPRNQDEIGENELLVVSFGTSYNDSRAQDIKGIEDALQEAYPDWSVRRAFTAQIIINHVQAREDEKIDNMQQALDRAVANGVKNLVVQPTHLMHGAEYDEMVEAIEEYEDQFESIAIAEPMLGEVGEDATVINEDKAAVAEAITAEALNEAGYDSIDAAAEDGVAFVFMGHGTSHTAKISYSQMQTQMETLGYDNVFIGTVEGEPEDTACDAVIDKITEAGYTKVILRPLMVVAGDHANNDMAGDDDDSWKSMFEASGNFESVDAQISGLGRIDAIEQLYVAHTGAAIDSLSE